MGSSGGSSGGSNINYVRYADYVESKHNDFLTTIQAARIAANETNPYEDYVDVDAEVGFFGTGYFLSNFPPLYDMFGKFMAGLDIEVLWEQAYTGTIDSPVVGESVAAESSLLDDELVSNAIPRFQTGMRDINSVISSTFVLGKALIEETKTKLVAKYSADLRFSLIPIAQDRWKTHLEWNKAVIGEYAELMKFYFSTKIDIDEVNYAFAAKKALWPFNALEFERAALGALQGATTSKTDVAGASTASKVISGALSGAAMGAMVGGSVTKAVPAGAAAGSAGTYAGPGAIAGAVLGAAAAFTY
jgi:hypothetical protein